MHPEHPQKTCIDCGKPHWSPKYEKCKRCRWLYRVKVEGLQPQTITYACGHEYIQCYTKRGVKLTSKRNCEACRMRRSDDPLDRLVYDIMAKAYGWKINPKGETMTQQKTPRDLRIALNLYAAQVAVALCANLLNEADYLWLRPGSVKEIQERADRLREDIQRIFDNILIQYAVSES